MGSLGNHVQFTYNCVVEIKEPIHYWNKERSVCLFYFHWIFFQMRYLCTKWSESLWTLKSNLSISGILFTGIKKIKSLWLHECVYLFRWFQFFFTYRIRKILIPNRCRNHKHTIIRIYLKWWCFQSEGLWETHKQTVGILTTLRFRVSFFPE